MLIDQLMRGPVEMFPGFEKCACYLPPVELLQQATRFRIDNVARYLYQGTTQELWCFNRDFPNVAPPYPVYWMEWREPPTMRFETGVFIAAVKLSDEGGGWQVRAVVFTKFSAGGPPSFVGGLQFAVKPDGSLPEREGGIPVRQLLGGSDMPGEVTKLAESLAYPAFLATSFLHCKNTTVNAVVPSPALRKKHARRGHACYTYHTLDIEPMRRVLHSEGDSDKQGLQKAIHICRGHFKDYRERGLFGRESLKGIYWWESSVRGSREAGVARKDYTVAVPTSGGQDGRR